MYGFIFFRDVALYEYAVSLRTMWIKSFGVGFVASLSAVKNRLSVIMKDFDSQSKLCGLSPSM